MEIRYFTFGSDPRFPYGINDYVVTIGKDRRDCVDAYRKKHPDRDDSGIINCASVYSADEWARIEKEYFKDVQPKEVIVSDIAYGNKPDGFEPIWFYVPERGTIVFLQKGLADNLTEKEVEEGNVDYLDVTSYCFGYGEIDDDDGGELLLPYMAQEHYECLTDSIPDVLDFLYGNMFLEAIIMKSASK